MKSRRFSIGLVSLALLFWLNPSAPAQISPSKPEDRIFITRAVQQQFVVNGQTRRSWAPTREKIGFAWSDQPFALHIPFDLLTKRDDFGQSMNGYTFTMSWRGFKGEGDRRYQPAVLTAGFYRFDNQPVRPQRDQNPVLVDRDVRVQVPNLDDPEAIRQSKKPASTYLSGYTSGPGRTVYWMVLDPRERPRTDEERDADRVMSVNGLPPHVWRVAQTLTGSFSVTIQENGKAAFPAREFELTLKQNGWEIRGGRSTLYGDLTRNRLDPPSGADYLPFTLQDLGIKVDGPNFVASHRMHALAKNGTKPEATIDVNVTFKLLPRILDHFPIQGILDLRQVAGGKLQPFFERYGLLPNSSVVISSWQYSDGNPDQQKPAAILNGKTAATYFTVNTAAAQGQARIPNSDLSGESFYVPIDGARGQYGFDSGRDFGSVRAGTSGNDHFDNHRLFTMDLLFAGSERDAKPQPAKRVDIFAVRISDVESNRDEIPEPVQPSVPAPDPVDDGYWEWLTKFNSLREETLANCSATTVLLRLAKAAAEAKRAQWYSMMHLDQIALAPDPNAPDGFWAQVATWARHSVNQGRDIPLGLSQTRFVLEDFREQRGQLQADIWGIRQQQEKLIQESLREVKQLVESADVQMIRSRESPDHMRRLNSIKETYQGRLELQKLSFYDAAGWYGSDELQKVLNDFIPSAKDVRELAELMKAKSALARAKMEEQKLAVALVSPNPVPQFSPAEVRAREARIEAMTILRRLRQDFPDNRDARLLLAANEKQFLSWIAQKLEREKQVSMGEFEQYLEARGYQLKEPASWWEGLVEYSRFSNLGSSILQGAQVIVGSQRASEISERAGNLQIKTARAQVGLLAMKHLCDQGLSLQEISQLSPGRLAETLALRDANGQALDVAKARQLSDDIRVTFEDLGELQGLVSGDKDDFEKFFERNYYQSIDPRKTWGEFGADLLPELALQIVLPYTTVSVGGSFLKSLTTTSRGLTLLEKGVKCERVCDIFEKIIESERLAERIAKSPAASFLQSAIRADQELIAGLSTGRRVLNYSARFAGMVGFYAGLSYLAEDSHVPGARLLVEALILLNLQHALGEVLAKNGTPAARIAAKIRQIEDGLVASRAELAEAGAAIKHLQTIAKKSGSPAAGLTAEEAKQLQNLTRALAPEAVPDIPGLAKGTDLREAINAARRALQSGNRTEALQALETARALHEEMQNTLGQFTVKMAEVRDALAKLPPKVRVEPGRKYQELKAEKPDLFLPKEYPKGTHGEWLKLGDQALRRDRIEDALMCYRLAKRDAALNGFIDSNKLIDSRITLAKAAREEAEKLSKNAAALGQAVPAHPATAPIGQAEVDLIREKLQFASSGWTIEMQPGSMNPVYVIKEGGQIRYILKLIGYDQDGVARSAEEMLNEMGTELAGARLVNAVKGGSGTLQAAASIEADFRFPLRRLYPDATGKLVEKILPAKGLLMRYVANTKTLWGISEPSLIALKRQYAIQTALRTWFCDGDGHIGNILLDSDSGLWMIDFGMGTLFSDTYMRQLARQCSNQKEMMEAALDLADEFYLNYYLRHNHGPQYAWMKRFNSMLSFDEMKSTVEAIQRLCADSGEGGLRKILEKSLPAGKADEAFRVLNERAKLLKEVLEKKFPTYQAATSRPPARLTIVDVDFDAAAKRASRLALAA